MKNKDVSPETFEELAQPPKPIPADEMAEIARAQLPRQGYVADYEAATERGRQQIDAGKRGLRTFPPARKVVEP